MEKPTFDSTIYTPEYIKNVTSIEDLIILITKHIDNMTHQINKIAGVVNQHHVDLDKLKKQVAQLDNEASVFKPLGGVH